jgi:hypothetical protein
MRAGRRGCIKNIKKILAKATKYGYYTNRYLTVTGEHA